MNRTNTKLASLIARRAFGIHDRFNLAGTEREHRDAVPNGTSVSTGSVIEVERENVAAAENAIGDLDFVGEASGLTRAQILANASTPILSLASSQPQATLALLA